MPLPLQPVGPRDYPNLGRLFFDRAATLGDAPFLHLSTPAGWTTLSWRAVAEAARAHAAGFAALGLGRGDRLFIVADNGLEWVLADIAALALGAIVVPGYPTATPDDWLQMIDDARPTLALVAPDVARRMTPRLADFRARVPQWIVAGTEGQDGKDAGGDFTPWDATRRDASANFPDLDSVGLDDVACLMYTSGTSGRPRGVMTTHRNILAACHGAATNLAAYGLDGHRFLAFLPLSHTYAHTGDLWTPIAISAQVFISRGTDHLPGEMQHARPTMMNTVPRLWEVMYKRIRHGLERESPIKRRLFAVALATGTRRLLGQPMGFVDRVLDAVAERTVRAKVRARFGGALRCALCAGAPLNREIAVFFNALGIRLHQAYGQTEATPGITMNTADRLAPGTVGPPMAGVEVRIAEDGEILVRGENVMIGYWNDATATAATLRDGWLHTGDVGRFDAEGNLLITDRKRDFVKTAGGEMIAPQVVEQALLLEGAIGQAVVCGDARPYLTALLVPADELRAEREAGRLDPATLAHRIEEAVAAANRRLPAPLRVRRHAVLEQPFEIGSGLMTPTLKVRRRAVGALYADRIEALYG